MSDEDDDMDLDDRSRISMTKRIERLSARKRELGAEIEGLKQQLKERDEAIKGLEGKITEAGKAAKEAQKVLEERDALLKERDDFTMEREIVRGGITDPEGIDAARWAWGRLPEEGRPESMAKWLENREALPKVLKPFLPQENGAGTTRRPPDPSAGVRAPGAAAQPPQRTHGGASPKAYAGQRAALYQELGISPPRLPGQKDET